MWKEVRIHSGLLIVALIYGINYSVAKYIMPEFVQPFGLILIRVVCAAFGFWLITLFTNFEKIRRPDLPRFIACGFFGVALNQLCFFKGLSLTSPIHASVLMLVTPILVLAGAAVILKEKIILRRWVGIILGIAGAGLLVSSAGVSDKISSLEGDIYIIVNAAAYAVYLIIAKPLLNRYNALTVSLYTFLFGLPFVLPFGWLQVLEINYANLPATVWAGLAFIVVFVTLIAYLLNAWTMRFVSPGVVGSYVYLQPVLAGLIAVSLGSDVLTWQKTLFTVLIFTGVYLSRASVKE